MNKHNQTHQHILCFFGFGASEGILVLNLSPKNEAQEAGMATSAGRKPSLFLISTFARALSKAITTES